MPFAQRTVYALRAVYELTRRYEFGSASIRVIADAQALPPRFLEIILLQLKNAGIVNSTRGREGGYRLARPPEEITVGQVLRATEGNLHPVTCLGGASQENCPMKHHCVFLPMWERANDAMLAVYDGTTYGDLLNQERTLARDACAEVR